MFAFAVLLVCLVNSPSNCNSSQDGCFRAAVYEHIRQGTVSNQTRAVQLNLDVYEEVAKIAAKNKADIIVYPEDGLFFPVGSRSDVRPLLEEVPDPLTSKHNPCLEADEYDARPILRRLSCAARQNQLHLVADLGEVQRCNQTSDPKCPSDGAYQYNTAVVFDDGGNLLAKYRKMHLFGESYYDQPPKPELIFIDTRMGRLGLFICFDMIFEEPGINLTRHSGVQTMLFPTWWFNQLPFLGAAQYQQAWAIINRVNLLAANIHLPKVYSFGSGIYSGRRGALVHTNAPDDKARLLLANVPVDPNSKDESSCRDDDARVVELDDLKLDKPYFEEDHMKVPELSMNLSHVSQVLLTKNADQVSKCSNNEFCCHLNYSANRFEANKKYYLIAANRIRLSTYSWCEEMCALVKCLPDAKTNQCSVFPTTAATVFTNISLSSSNFSTEFVYPSAVGNQLKLFPKNSWSFSVTELEGQFESTLTLDSNADPVLMFGLYGRCYQNDPPFQQVSIGNSIARSSIAIFICLIASLVIIF